MGLRFAAFSECGPIRALNADALLAQSAEGFFAIADGVGSTFESARASVAAVQSVYEAFLAAGGGAAFADIDLDHLIADAYGRFKAALGMDERQLPSSTLTLVLLRGHTLRYVSVGDSPLFWIDGDRISLLTREHTMVDQGRIIANFSEMKSQDGSHILVNTFGRHSPRATLYEPVQLSGPCRLMLCSDGLLDFLSQTQLGNLSAANETIEDLVAAIHATAGSSRPNDNYSGLVIEIPEGQGS